MVTKRFLAIFLALLAVVLFSGDALAFTIGLEDIGENIIRSSARLPGLIAALCYLIGTAFGIWGITKTIDHVNNPSQTPIRVPVTRFAVGGMLFALPIIYEAARISISGGTNVTFGQPFDINVISGALGMFVGFITGMTFATMLQNIIAFSSDLPAVVAGVAYLLGLVIATNGVIKIKEHVEEPERVSAKEPTIRLLTAGALFALPHIFRAMYTTISGGGLGVIGTFYSVLAASGFVYSSYSISSACIPGVSYPLGTVGATICNSMIVSLGLPSFLNAFSYFLGLIFGVWGLLKIRDHVLSPQQTPVSEGIMRLLAGGAFFAMPFVAMSIYASVTPFTNAGISAVAASTGYRATGLTCTATNSLDEAMGCFMNNIMAPTHVVLNFFCFVAGLIFIMIGISRLIKSSQEGARGPGGKGTVATFAVGGLLMSASALIRGISASLFMSPVTSTTATLTYTTGMTATETNAIYNVINAVLKFMIIVGMISFVRGLFIMRDVAEGNQQASTMSGLTHIIGGALAVNMGPVLNAVQSSLGITAYGLSFT